MAVRGQARMKRVANVATYAALTFGALIMVLPVVWMMVASFQTPGEISHVPPILWPRVWSITNYAAIGAYFNFARYLLNSVLVVIVVTGGTLLLSLVTGYVFAKHQFPGRQFLFVLMISAMFIPFQVLVVPLFLVVHSIGWIDTYAALMIPPLFNGFALLLLRQFIVTIPSDYIDAARIDGAREVSIIFRIIAPLAAPALSAVAIFTFLGNWDSLLWPVVAISSSRLDTLPLGVAGLAFSQGAQFNLLLAAGTLTTIPVLVVFLALQRHFVQGVALSGIKG